MPDQVYKTDAYIYIYLDAKIHSVQLREFLIWLFLEKHFSHEHHMPVSAWVCNLLIPRVFFCRAEVNLQ